MTFRRPECTCQIDREFESLLVPHLEAAAPGSWPGFLEVKNSTVRRVLSGQLEDGQGHSLKVHLKLFRPATLSDRARDALRGSRAAREFENLRECLRRGLPTVRPIAHGRFGNAQGMRSFLITESLDRAEALPRGPIPEAAASSAGELLRQAHDRGLHARDLHPGNILITPSGQLALVDLTSASLANPLEREERARALAFFCQDLDGGLGDPTARPLALAYGADEKLIDQAVRQGRRLRNRALSAFGRRALRACRHSKIESLASGSLYCYSSATDLHAAARAWRPDCPDNETIKSGRRGAVYFQGDLVIKLRPQASAKKLAVASFWLMFAGVHGADPVAVRIGPGQCWFLTRRLPWPNLAEEFARRKPGQESLVSAAGQLGDAVGRMHAHGLRNRDLKFENLVRNPESNRIYMVDLDGMRRHHPLDTRGQAADLGRLLAAYRSSDVKTDPRILRAFLRGYLSSHKSLCLKPASNLYRHSEARAQEWARAHPGRIPAR